MNEIPIKLEMTASQKNGMLVLSFGDYHLSMDEDQARDLKVVLDSWLAGDKTSWGPRKPDDPNPPRGKPHKWEPGFLERIASLPKPPNDGSD